MKFKKLGNTDLDVSLICLGTMTWGTQNSEKDAFEQMDYSISEGVNFFDTAEIYSVPPTSESYGKTEIMIGNWFEKRKNREKIILASKVAGPGCSWIRGGGNNFDEKKIKEAIDGSLKRLKTDFIDVLWLHIWDYSTPYDEIVLSINDLIKEGKILYAGLSSVPAWQIARMNSYADHHGLHPFIALQNEWSLVERSHEPEYLPMCKELDLGITCWSPLHGGLLSGKYTDGSVDQSVPNRMLPHVTDPSQFWYEATQRNLAILKDLQPIVDEVGEPWSAFALRWLMQRNETVTIPIYSARTEAQSQESLRATEFELSEDQMKRINEITAPAISSPYPAFGPYPYTMLEYGSPALPNFYSRALLYGETESMIKNHRVSNPYTFYPSTDA